MAKAILQQLQEIHKAKIANKNFDYKGLEAIMMLPAPLKWSDIFNHTVEMLLNLGFNLDWDWTKVLTRMKYLMAYQGFLNRHCKIEIKLMSVFFSPLIRN